ncbi:MAG: hypothetical protein AAF567_24450 [Actinomycetota bacterium]
MTGSAVYADRATPDILAAKLDPRFKRHPHIKLIAVAILEAIFDPNIDCVIIRTPPRVGKSTIVNWVIVWLLDWFPELPIITTSYAIRLSRRNSRRIRNIFARYASKLRTAIGEDQTAAEQWETDQGGGVLASAVRAALSGFDAGVVFVDDPHKSWAEAQSPVIRDGTWDWFESEAETRAMEYTFLVGGKPVTIYPTYVLVHTAFHPDDLSHRAEKKYSAMVDPDTGKVENRCKVVHIPAIADPNIVDPDPLGRDPGESICEEMHPAKRYRRIFAATSKFIVAALYQGAPLSTEDELVERAWWSWADKPPKLERRIATFTSWDLTFKRTGKSWVVGQLWTITRSLTEPDKLEFWLLDQIRRKAGFVEQRLIIRAFAEKHPDADWHLIEDAANGPAIIDDLRLPWIDTQAHGDDGTRRPAVRSDLYGEKRWPAVAGVVAVPAVGTKPDRLVGVSPTIRDGRCHLPAWWEPTSEPRYPGDRGDIESIEEAWAGLINECADMPNAANDDQADCLSQAIRWGIEHVNGGSTGESSQSVALQHPPKVRRRRRKR